MISIVPITPANAMIFKEVRLRALQESPGAFGSTWARESAFSDTDWLERVRKWNGERGVGFLAVENNIARGLAGSFLDEGDPTRAHLLSMWTDAESRRRGVGWLLVTAVAEWAHGRGAHTLLLMVTSNNAPAILFYEKLGFTRTGRTEPYPNNPAVVEYEMSRPI